MPRAVSVVMAAWNVEQHIEAAVGSVLSQTYPILELVVVDDGSTDSTPARLQGIASRDARLRVVRQPNSGFASARNAALRLVRGEWIANADADDVQLPHRIAEQMKALDVAPEVTVCGGAVEVWDGSEQPGRAALQPSSDAEIRTVLPFGSPIFDPTVVYRASLLPKDQGLYDPSFRMAADYDLWTRLAPSARFMNLPQVLTRYRRHPSQITEIARKSGFSSSDRRRVWHRALGEMLGIVPTSPELDLHEFVSSWSSTVPNDRLGLAPAWFTRLKQANRLDGRLDSTLWERALAFRWFWIHRHAESGGARVLWRYFSSSLAWNGAVPLRSKAALIRRGFVGPRAAQQ